MHSTSKNALAQAQKKPNYRRLLIWLLASLLALLCLLVGGVWWQQKALIAFTLARINERLDAPVRVDRIHLTWWATFPRLALQFDSVIVAESGPNQSRRLASIGKVRLGFSPWQVIQGHYIIQYLSLEGGYVYLRHRPDGTNNYEILKASVDTAGQKTPPLSLREIKLKDLSLRYADEGANDILVATEVRATSASIKSTGPVTELDVQMTDATLQTLKVGNASLANDLPISLNQHLTVSKGVYVLFAPSTLQVAKATFQLTGKAGIGQEAGIYRFEVTSKGGDLAALAILLPPEIRQDLLKYKTEGKTHFSATINCNRPNGDEGFPGIKALFGVEKASFKVGEYGLAFKNVYLEGKVNIPEGVGLPLGRLNINQVHGSLQGHPFSGRLTVNNFTKPSSAGFAKATIPLALFAKELQKSGIGSPQGLLALDLQMNTPAGAKLQTEGKVDLQDIGFTAGHNHIPFTHWQGTLSFRKSTLVAEALAGFIGASDLSLQGKIENLEDYLAGKRPKLDIQATVKSHFLDLDELLTATEGQPKTRPAKTTKKPAKPEEEYRFVVAPGLEADAYLRIDHLRFRRFSPKQIDGHLQVHRQHLQLHYADFSEAAGRVKLSGNVDASKENMPVEMKYQLTNVRIDSLFYVMENFKQQTLRHNQIEGRLNSDGNFSFFINHQLDVDPASVVAASTIHVTEGALIDFEPAQALGRFLDKKELAHLRFSELENTFTIQNQLVTIPEMDIRSNVFRCYVKGTHTFKQDMDYHLRIPTKYLSTSSLDAKGPELGRNILLTLRGRIPDLKVGYDFGAVKQKIATVMKEEKSNLLNLFRRKIGRKSPPTPEITKPDPKQEEEKEKPKFLDLD